MTKKARTEKQRMQSKQWYDKNRDRILSELRLKRKNSPEYRQYVALHQEKCNRKVANLWGAQVGHRRGKENVNIAVQSELFCAQTILPKHNFTNILVCRIFAGQFPFDILAKKDGKVTAIDVTTSYYKTIRPEKGLLLEFLNADLYICHLKPDFSKYFLLPLDIKKKLHSTCRGIFMEQVRNVSFV
jgi:hypothetical protein